MGVGLCACILMCSPSAVVRAEATNNSFTENTTLIITEVQAKSIAGGEYIELYNNSDEAIDLSSDQDGGKWSLQYFTKSKLASLASNKLDPAGWVGAYKVQNLSGSIGAHQYMLIASSGYLGTGSVQGVLDFALADETGALQLIYSVGSNTIVHDRMLWADETTLPTLDVWCRPAKTGETLQRTLNDEDMYVDSDGLLEPWQADDPTPGVAWLRPAPIEPELPGDDSVTDGDNQDNQPPDDPVEETPAVVLAPPYISEILPNPSGDETDEYIELYNPNSERIDISGFKLQTGLSTVHSFTFDETAIEGESYLLLRYSTTKLALSNTGSRVVLLDQFGQTIAQSDAYTKANEDEAWAYINAEWKWTAAPTPGTANQFLTPKSQVMATLTGATSKKSTGRVKGVSTKTAKAKKPKKTKSIKSKKPKKTRKVSADTGYTNRAIASAAQQEMTVHPTAIAAVLITALGYIGYEYRRDIANIIYKFRRH